MSEIEGKITIELDRSKPNKERVSIESSRPVQASRVLHDKTAQQALETIPLLFNVCGTAQTRTARRAMQQQLGISSSVSEELARDMLVLVENAREHLLRALLDWPRLFQLKLDNPELAPVTRLVNDFKQALFRNGDAFSLDSQLQVDADQLKQLIADLERFLKLRVYGLDIDQWLTMKDIDGINYWTQNIPVLGARTLKKICDLGFNSQGYADSNHLPDLAEDRLLEKLNAEDADHFIAEPQWNGECFETTSLGRQHDHALVIELDKEFHNTLITRWVARLVELARIPDQLRALLRQIDQAENNPGLPASNLGIAQTEAARGRLIHHVEIENDTIKNYQIVAPTEWNFHPQGVINRSLSNLSCGNVRHLTQVAHLMINTIDPCVGYELTVH